MSEEEIKSWLNVALENEKLSDISVFVVGNSEKGDGYMGDIVFVKVNGKRETQSTTHDLVLKCSKKSQALREALPIKECFENEIYLYETIIPAFTQFQKERGSTEVFHSVPKSYGHCVSENEEVIVLENLKANGYYLFDSKKPLPTNHLKLILAEYGKWHAISVAMQEQEPEKFGKLVEGMINVWKLFCERVDPEKFFLPPIEEICEILKPSLSSETAVKLENFKSKISYVIKELIHNNSYFSVITHGDCWNNNFMFKTGGTDEQIPTRVAMLDWQTAKLCNPAADISYFIFACSSEEDLKNLDYFLKFYYDHFTTYARLLGSDAEKLFSFDQFLDDFKVFGKYGAMMTMLAIKVALSDKEESPEFGKTAEHGFESTFNYKNRDQTLLKNRVAYIVEHLARQDIL